MVHVLESLVSLGHEVSWLCLPRPGREVEAVATRLPLQVLGLIEGYAAPWTPGARVDVSEDYLRKIYADRAESDARLVDPTRRLIASVSPDVVVVDGQKDFAWIAAHLSGLPYAVLSHTLLLSEETATMPCDLHRAVASVAAARLQLFRNFGAEPTLLGTCVPSPLLNVMFSTNAFMGPVHLPSHSLLAGPSLDLTRGPDASLSRALDRDHRPLVYVALGTQYSWQPELFRTIARALRSLDVAVCAAVGGLDPAIVNDELPHAVVVRSADQLRMLERASVFITHCGANSVMESIYHGVPMVGIPLAVDQPVLAALVKAAGVGEDLVSAQAATAERIRAAVEGALLPDAEMRSRCLALRDDYRRHEGGAAAARALENLVS